MSRPIRVAVVGLGQMGSAHAEVFKQNSEAELVAVADVSSERLQSCTEALQVRGYRDYSEMLDQEELDAVDICTPDNLHLAPAVAAAEAGKHILLEKPLATDPAEGRAIIEASRRHGVKLMVGHLLRFDPRYAAVRRAIQSGEVGEVTHIMAHRNSPWTQGPARYAPGTSLTMHVAIHDLDLVNWFLAPARPTRVYAMAVRKRLRNRDMDDAVSALIEFDNGAVANLQYSWSLPPQSVTLLDARLEVIATEGMALVGGYHGQSVFIGSIESGVHAPDVHHNLTVDGVRTGDLCREIAAFVRCIAEDRPSPVPVDDALLALLEAQAITASVTEGRPVSLEP